MVNESDIPLSYWKRMERQIPIFGEKGQLKIARTKVVIGGAGGNGMWSALFCALVGILRLIVIDRDEVEFSNLNRSPFCSVKDVGEHKSHVTKRELESRFPEMRVKAVVGDIRSPDVWDQIRKCRWFIENVDNDETRFFINEQCIKDGINLVSVATGFRFRDGRMISAGSRAVRVIPGDACLVCSALGDIPSDNAIASLLLPNVIAADLGVNFVIREITRYAGDEQNGANLIMFDLLNMTLTTEKIVPTPGCQFCDQNSGK